MTLTSNRLDELTRATGSPSLARLAIEHEGREKVAADERAARLRQELEELNAAATASHAAAVDELAALDAEMARAREAWDAVCARREALRIAKEHEAAQFHERPLHLQRKVHGPGIHP